jgi:steroid 5-alpha reductase family enzyme
MTLRTRGRIIQCLAYILVFTVTWVVTILNFPDNSLVRVAFLFGYSTLGIFIFSAIFNNSSIFDPYWSVMPVFLLTWFSLHPDGHWWQVSVDAPEVSGHWLVFGRLILVFLLVLTWGTRLTWNFFRGWAGLPQEDWRYVNFRKTARKAYWPVSMVGIHFFPAFMVFLGCLPLWVIFYRSDNPFNMLDVLALIVTLGAILLEARADRQLNVWLRSSHDPGKTMRKGLWAVSRHPNYLGEISFWWGLFLFGLAANTTAWWIIAGPVLITLMFVFISIPLIEKRMMERRIDYAEYRRKVSMLLPFPVSS